MSIINRLNSSDADFSQRLDKLLAWESVSNDAVNAAVADIITGVRRDGDAALLAYTQKFDHLTLASAGALEVSKARLKTAYESIPADQRDALTAAADRIRR